MPCSFRACSGRSATWLSTLAGTPRTSWGCCASFVSLHPARLIPPPTPANRRVPGKGTRVNPSRPEGAEAECLGIFLAGGSRRREWQLQRIHLEQFQCRCIVDSGETLRQTGNGEIVWGRSAAQAAAGPRPWGRNTRATGGALLGERAVGMEDLRPA